MNDDRAIYLNHAGTSWPKPQSVLQAAESAMQLDPSGWPSLFQSAHQVIADFFHVEMSRLLLTPSCTAALQVAVMDHAWQPTDRVISSGYEHHALHRTLVKLSELGVRVTTLPSDTVELIDLQALESELKSGQVRLVALTAACNVTGQLLPIEEAIKLAHQYGASILIDGAQIAGWWDLDLRKLGVDLFTFAGHKGPQGPWGVGGLYVSPGLSMNCPAAACERPEPKAELRCSIMPGYCDVGSVNLVALAGLAAGCRWLADPEQSDRLPQARRLASQFTAAMRDHPEVVIHGDIATNKKVPTVAVTVENLASVELAKRLREVGVIASGGFQCAPQAHQSLDTGRNGVLRFSFGPKSNEFEVSRAISLFSRCLIGG